MPEFRDKAYFPDVYVVRETELAILVEFGGREEWIPQSQIDDDSEVWADGDSGTLTVSQWIAEQKGLS